MTARNIPGWNSDITPWQKFIAPRIPQGGTYLEIGVFLGASLVTMGRLRPDLNLIAVDPWPQGWASTSEYGSYIQERGGLFLAFLRTMLEHAPDVLARTRVIRGSVDNIQIFTPVNLLFVDGVHTDEHVTQDLRTFAPLVLPGGIVAGHDYDSPPAVKVAVDRYFGRMPNVGTGDGAWSSCWWVEP